MADNRYMISLMSFYAFLPSRRLATCKLVGCIPALFYWAQEEKKTNPDGVEWLRAKVQSRFNHSNFLEFVTTNNCSINVLSPVKVRAQKRQINETKYPKETKRTGQGQEEGCNNEVSSSEEKQE